VVKNRIGRLPRSIKAARENIPFERAEVLRINYY
jgi:hypothetical protein